MLILAFLLASLGLGVLLGSSAADDLWSGVFEDAEELRRRLALARLRGD